MAPSSFLLLSYLLVWTLLEDGEGDQVLHVLSLVTGQEVGGHPTHILTFLVVRFVITPSQGHRLLGRICGGGHPYIVCSPTLWSS